MKTNGYDLLLQVDERLLNKALSAVFYTGLLKRSGTYAFINGVPEELRGFTEIAYRIRLTREPLVDFKGKDTTGLQMSVEIELKVLTGVDIKLNVDFGATAQIRIDIANRKVVYDLTESSIYDIVINDQLQFHQNALDRMNTIIKILIGNYLTADLKEIQLPIEIMNLLHPKVPVPTLPDSAEALLPVKVADAAIIDNRLVAIGINIFDDASGSFDGLTDLTEGSELFAALRVDAMLHFAQFWWEHTELEKKESFDGVLHINSHSSLAKGTDLLTKIVTLGLLETKTDINKLDLVYDATVELQDLPQIEFSDGNRAELHNLKLKLIVNAHMEETAHRSYSLDTSGFIPDRITPWNDDIKLGERDKNEQILHLTETLLIDVPVAACTVQIDDRSRLVLKVVAADLELDFGNNWFDNFTDRVMNHLLNTLEEKLISKIPPIVISPSLLLADKEVHGYTFTIGIHSLDLQPETVAICCIPKINQFMEGSMPVPLYIANRKSMKLHRFDCPVVEEMDFTHRLGYHVIYEAIKDGYKPCGQCLQGYPKSI